MNTRLNARFTFSEFMQSQCCNVSVVAIENFLRDGHDIVCVRCRAELAFSASEDQERIATGDLPRCIEPLNIVIAHIDFAGLTQAFRRAGEGMRRLLLLADASMECLHEEDPQSTED